MTGLSARTRARLIALTVSLGLVIPVSAVATTAAHAYEYSEIPISAGTPSTVVATVGDLDVQVTYSDVPVDGFVGIIVEPFDPENYAPLPSAAEPLIVVRTILYDETGQFQDVASQDTETCVDLSPLGTFDSIEMWEQDRFGTDFWQEASLTSDDGSQLCAHTDFGDVTYLFTVEEIFELDLEITRVFEPLDIGFGEGPQNGVYLTVDAVNNDDEPITLGLGADLSVEGVDEKLWLEATWGLSESSGLEDFFTRTIAPGESASLQVPDWPGKTYSFWAVNDSAPSQSVLLETYETGGLFSRLNIDINSGTVEIGSVAEFAGTTVFPGVTTTIEAAGLIPGESYELWLTPGVDYLSFMLLGGLLADGAVQVGTATVNSAGVLATTFSVPTTVAVGDRYQLMIGDPNTRSWPAGTVEQIEIVNPQGGGTVDGPAPADLVVSIPAGVTEVLFSFPAGTSEGQTTASASTTGPAAVGFTIPGNPPIYLHLSSTATFTGTVEVCVDVPSGSNPATLNLYHYELGSTGYAWSDITTRRTATAVCGETDSFSPFALGIPDAVRLTSKDDCKQGGWKLSTAPVFRNQGLCVSYFARRV